MCPLRRGWPSCCGEEGREGTDGSLAWNVGTLSGIRLYEKAENNIAFWNNATVPYSIFQIQSSELERSSHSYAPRSQVVPHCLDEHRAQKARAVWLCPNPSHSSRKWPPNPVICAHTRRPPTRT
eukprot:3654865-Prymnesium_polylepis.1